MLSRYIQNDCKKERGKNHKNERLGIPAFNPLDIACAKVLSRKSRQCLSKRVDGHPIKAVYSAVCSPCRNNVGAERVDIRLDKQI